VLRVANRHALESILQQAFSDSAHVGWVADRAAGIPYSPVRTFQEALGRPSTGCRDMFLEIEVRSSADIA
jgi:crotonobetainyl-CoA:carnitine CoA-transferase CaiB-like acyl-CoA transferase